MEIQSMIFARDMTFNRDGTSNLLGCFDAIMVAGPPYWTPNPIIAVVGLSVLPHEVDMMQQMTIDVVHQQTGRSMGQNVIPYAVHNLSDWIRFREFQAIFRFLAIEFSLLGFYDFNLYVDGQFKRSRTIRVFTKEQSDEVPNGIEHIRFIR